MSNQAVHSDGFSGAPSRWRINKHEDRLPLCAKIITGLNPSSLLSPLVSW